MQEHIKKLIDIYKKRAIYYSNMEDYDDIAIGKAIALEDVIQDLKELISE